MRNFRVTVGEATSFIPCAFTFIRVTNTSGRVAVTQFLTYARSYLLELRKLRSYLLELHQLRIKNIAKTWA
jgi:hypothetical protein